MKRWDAGQRLGLAADRCREVRRLLRVQVVVAEQPMPTVKMLGLTQEQPQLAMATAGQVQTWPEFPHVAGHRH